jgi:hypothetical protein
MSGGLVSAGFPGAALGFGSGALGGSVSGFMAKSVCVRMFQFSQSSIMKIVTFGRGKMNWVNTP